MPHSWWQIYAPKYPRRYLKRPWDLTPLSRVQCAKDAAAASLGGIAEGLCTLKWDAKMRGSSVTSSWSKHKDRGDTEPPVTVGNVSTRYDWWQNKVSNADVGWAKHKDSAASENMIVPALRSSQRPFTALVKSTGQVLPSGDYGAEIEPASWQQQQSRSHRLPERSN